MLSIIIVSFNTRDLLKQCLHSVCSQCSKAEIIVVDNASRDGSPEMVRAEFPQVMLVPLSENFGFAAANNAGLPLATGNFILFLNSDTFLEDDSLDRCVAWMERHPEVGALSPRLVGIDDRPQPCLRPFPSLKEKLREALRLSPRPSLDGEKAPAGWLAGTALMIRREALREAGDSLDPTFFMYWEDVDLSSRLAERGWKQVAYEGAHVRHYGGASGGGPSEIWRADLYAWFVYGKYCWFARHRPWWESVALWLLDGHYVVRKFMRGLRDPGRRGEMIHALVLAGVLARKLFGLTPPWPRM